MKTQRQTTGKRGELEAERFLVARGHTIIARNWRSGHLELDLITLNGDGLHIVEVKSRTAPAPERPEYNVDGTKMARLTRAARSFLSRREDYGIPGDVELFFDVASVLFTETETKVDWYPEAFIPLYV